MKVMAEEKYRFNVKYEMLMANNPKEVINEVCLFIKPFFCLKPLITCGINA